MPAAVRYAQNVTQTLQWLHHNYRPAHLFVCDKETPWNAAAHLPGPGPRWEVDHVHVGSRYIGSGFNGCLCWTCGARWVERAGD